MTVSLPGVGRWSAGVGTAALLALTGCTTTVAGHGQAAAVNEHPFTVSTSAPTVAAPTGPTSTSPTTSPASTASTPPTTVSASKPASAPGAGATRAQLTARLGRLTLGQRRTVVALPPGGATVAEAATYDQAGHVTFWRYTASWSRAGKSTYPYDAVFVGAPSVVITGTVLTAMTHATFIARGVFSGDGSGNAIAYTTGPKGWGAIKAEPNGDIGPSGTGVAFSSIGLADDFRFVHGLLESADCSSTLPISSCGGNQRVLKFWRWAGHDFVVKSRAGLAH